MARTADPAVRTALIEAAAQRLATEGLDALSLRQVAAAVGTTTQAVYTHFGSKEDLVRAVVAEAFARLEAELAAAPHTDDPVGDLVGLGIAYRRNALANAHLYRVMFGLNPLALTDPAVEASIPGSTDPAGGADGADGADAPIGLAAFGVLVAAMARCVDAQLLVGDPAALARSVWATAHGAVSLELAGFLGDPAAAEATYAEATAATFAGLPHP